MKDLSSYIQEKQLNEGLISDLILRIYDTGISWINNTFKFMGDGIKYSVKTTFETIKDAVTKNRETVKKIYGTTNPEKINKTIMSSIYNKKSDTFDSRLNNIYVQLKKLKEIYKDDDAAFSKMKCNLLYTECLFTINNKNSSDKEKSKAKDMLEKLNKEYPNIMKNISKK